jgi:putative copper resistance protein D
VTILAIVRGVHLASLLTLFGAESFDALWHARGTNEIAVALPKRVRIWIAAIAFITALLWLLIAAAQIGGESILPDRATLTLVLGQTLFGNIALMRVAILLALLGATFSNAPAAMRVALSGAALAAIALTGHVAAAGSPDGLVLRAAVDAVHLLSAGFWIGGLAVFARLVVSERTRLRTLLPPLRVFSQWAVGAVALLVTAGSFNGYLVLFGGHGAWNVSYLTLLAAKLVLAALMVALALTNRFGIVPAMARGEPEANESLTMSVYAELVSGIFIVAIVGFLGLIAPRV